MLSNSGLLRSWYPDGLTKTRVRSSVDNPVHLGGKDDWYNGTSGSDLVYGGNGDDTLYGNGSNDILKGGKGDDAVSGGQGGDILVGGSGDDSLNGGKGHDLFHGGLGRDNILLLGDGRSRDTVIYKAAEESVPGERHDKIEYFQAGHDTVDLRRIDADTLTPEDDAFHWIGKDAFSGAAGELRYGPTTDGLLLQGDVDGDAVADFEVYFLSFAPLRLVADDFKL
jgi:serralysin